VRHPIAIIWLFQKNFVSLQKIMETITLAYKPNDIFAKKMLDAMLVSGAFSLKNEPQKSELQKSIEEAQKGKYFVAKNAKDVISKCLA
jgi:hypothetical protein